mmetsp:Transcript_4/g.13  ORF Transcript_4/g.13 Transcript_4/m.13 type:complete len:82 (+) Transcript_4:687-932(+)
MLHDLKLKILSRLWHRHRMYLTCYWGAACHLEPQPPHGDGEERPPPHGPEDDYTEPVSNAVHNCISKYMVKSVPVTIIHQA